MRPTKLLLCFAVLAGLLISSPFSLGTQIRGLKTEINPDNVKILLPADEKIQYSSFKSTENWVVVDLLDCTIENLEPSYPVSSPLLHHIKASQNMVGGKANTRLEFELRNGAAFHISDEPGRVLISIQAAETAPAKPAETGRGELKDLQYSCGEDVFELLLIGKNLAEYKNFRLADPSRLVIDLKNTICRYAKNTIPVNDLLVHKIRVSQFKNDEAATVRIVLDLQTGAGEVSARQVEDGLQIRFGKGVQRASQESPAEGKEIPVVPLAAASQPASLPVEQESSPAPPVKSDSPVITDASVVEIPEPVVRPKNIEPPLTPPAATPQLRMMTARPRMSAAAASLLQDEEGSTAEYTGEPVTLDIKDADIVDFFRLISDIEGLNIVVDPSVQGSISIKVENVPWDQVFDLALKNNSLAKVIEGNVVRIGTLDAFKKEEEARQELKRAKETTTDIIKINYATSANLLDKLQPLLTPSGELKTDARTNTIIVRDIPERINEIKKLAAALDKPEHQVEIEARIVQASRTFSRSIGVQWGIVAGNLERVTVGGPNTFSGGSGYRPSATPKSGFAGASPQGKGAAENKSSDNASTSPGGAGNYNVNMPAVGATSGIGISVGNILDTFLLDASITAAESSGQVRVISQPKVQAQNNRMAMIEQGIQFPVQVVENNTINVRFFSASLKLTVTPQITDEGTVLMKIVIENNRADFVNTVGLIPSIITSMSSTEVLVADGGTTVIGGILIDSDNDNKSKVPFLGDIPLLGNLFKMNNKTKETKEILFFLTPRIIK